MIHTVHGPPFHRYEKAWKNRLYIESEKFAAKRCHKLLCVANAMTDQYVDAGIANRSKFLTVHSGMDLSPYTDDNNDDEIRKSVREELQIPSDALVAVKVARLFELKGTVTSLKQHKEFVSSTQIFILFWLVMVCSRMR